jgi:hypothetical protein
MTTATKQHTCQAPPWAGRATVDFDTRLQLTGIYMDVVLEQTGGQQLADARAAATAAIAAADRYSAEATALEGLLNMKFRATDPTPDTPEGVLTLAADIIRERGWIQGRLVDQHSGAVCARQAIFLAAGGTDDQRGYVEAVGDRQQAAEALLLDRIRSEFGMRYGDVPVWNDSADTDQLGLFRLLY